MLVTILTSTKLYMKITENPSQKQELAIQYKSLTLDLFKILSFYIELLILVLVKNFQ